MTARARILAAAAALLVAVAGSSGAIACGGEAQSDRIVGIPARGELRLESGRTVRLSGVRLADAGAIGADARAALDALVQAPVTVRLIDAAPDRWGRVPGIVALADDADGADLARRLVARGLAFVDAGDMGRLCDPGLLEIETKARRDGIGLWAEPDAQPIAADDAPALAAARDRFALVEGRVRSVGVRERRVYLDFAGSDAETFTAVVPAEIFARLEASGLDARALRGRRIRVRGIIQDWRGAAVTVTAAETIEILEARPSVR